MFGFLAVEHRRLQLLVAGLLVALPSRPLGAQEAPGLVVRQLRFAGNRSIDELALKAAISTTESGFFARAGWIRWLGLGEKRYFREREFRIDVARIRLFYQMSGFLDATVDTVV